MIPYRERWQRSEGGVYTRAPHMMGMGMGVGFSAPPPWTPAADTTVLEWLEADYGVTATTTVSQVAARGSAAKALAQGTAGKQPAWVASGTSGILRFDGTDDVMRTAAFTAPLAQPAHHFVVCKATQTEAYDTLFSGISGANYHSLYTGTMGNASLIASAGSTGGAAVFTNGVWAIYDILYSGAASKIAANGGAQTTVNTGTNTLAGLCIGARYDGALTPPMDWYAHIVCAGDWSGAKRAQMLDYLRRKALAAGIVLP